MYDIYCMIIVRLSMTLKYTWHPLLQIIYTNARTRIEEKPLLLKYHIILSRDIYFLYFFHIISHHKFHILSTEGGWLTLIFLPYFIPDEERTTTTTCRVDDLNFTFTFAFNVNHFPLVFDVELIKLRHVYLPP